jgi:hypothetical protein
MMDMLVTTIQSLCGAGLILGIALSVYSGARPVKETKRFDYASANDFETGHRRWGRRR